MLRDLETALRDLMTSLIVGATIPDSPGLPISLGLVLRLGLGLTLTLTLTVNVTLARSRSAIILCSYIL